MAKRLTRGSDPRWLDDLHWRDRAIAERLLQTPGAAVFYRIARAATKREAHRPAGDLAPIVHAAAVALFTNDDRDVERAARETAALVVRTAAWEGAKPLTEAYLRRRLRDALSRMTAEEAVLARTAAREKRREADVRERRATRFVKISPDAPSSVGKLPMDGLARIAPTIARVGDAVSSMTAGLAAVAKNHDETMRLKPLAEALSPDADGMTIPELRELLRDIRSAIRRGAAAE